MPIVYTTHLLDDNGESVLQALSRHEPDETTFVALAGTAERLGLDVADVAVESAIACRGCGCTDERACPGGCEWVEDDLCSKCQLAESVRTPALVLP